MIEGRFGSMSADRCAYALRKLESSFGRDRLLTVPGFRQDERGRLGFTLWGDFTLIPYFDREGRVRTIEGRAIGEPPAWGAKYTSPRGAGNHLYVFPSFDPDDLVAFCEGPIGAIVAAQSGIPVGSIQGVKRYRAAGEDGPLPELSGVHFNGRNVAYIPDLDIKPAAQKDVETHLPLACDYLIARQGGAPKVVTLTEGKDLDEYLLSLSPDERKSTFNELLLAAVTPESWISGNRDRVDSTLEKTDNVPVGADPEQLTVEGVSVEPADRQSSADLEAPTQKEDTKQEPEPELPQSYDDEIAPADESADVRPEPHADDPQMPDPSEDLQESDEHAVYDRWYQGVSSSKAAGGQKDLENSIPYRPRQAEPIVPTGALATSHELARAAIAGLVGTILSWLFITLWAESELMIFGWLPAPPGLLLDAGGLLGALIGGVLFSIVALSVLTGRRRALRHHMRGDDIR